MQHPTYKETKTLCDALAIDERLPWAANHSKCAERRECAIGILLDEKKIDPGLLGRITVTATEPLRYFSNYALASSKTDKVGFTDYSGFPLPEQWTYHTALTIDTYNEGVDEVVPLVIDPSINPLRPLTVREFTDTLARRALPADDRNTLCLFTTRLGEALKEEDVMVLSGQEREKYKAGAVKRIKEWQSEVFTRDNIVPVPDGVVPLAHDWVKNGELKGETFREFQIVRFAYDLQYEPKGPERGIITQMRKLGLLGKGYVRAYENFIDQTPVI